MSQDALRGSVLIVDDDETFRQVLSTELAGRGYTVLTAEDGRSAVERASRDGPEVILLDLRLPDLDGLEVLHRLREAEVAAGVVVLTGHGTIDTALRAIRMGAYDFLEKPCPVEQVELAIQKTREHIQLVTRQHVLQAGYSPSDVRTGLVGVSERFQQLVQTVERVAQTDSTALIYGETGAGKEMVARLLHALGPRKDAPFVVVDCATLDEDLLRSELFGHEKGAFTGAVRRKHGLFEVADGGTLLLDEVGVASPEIQSKLLRVLETGRFRHLGGTREITVDVRVISATNRDLRQASTHGRFREDLYYRLATITIEVPPLRERLDDIAPLVEHYTARLNRRLSMSRHFTPEAVHVLRRHHWPGNVRELIHVVEQAMVLCDRDAIGPEDLSDVVQWRSSPPVSRDAYDGLSLQEVQRSHVLAVLEKSGGNRAQAARILEISERNLYRLLKRYGCSTPTPSADPDRMSGA